MPRAKKYHTAEEKRQAKAACMKRSYKARRDSVNQRRRELYAEKIAAKQKQERRAERQTRRNKDQEAVKDSQIRVQSIHASMNRILQGSVKEYLDKRMFWFEVDLTDPRPDTSVKVIQLHSSKV
ncbi:hypothetical protein FA13DRAFT_1797026 [Coprinellus micaceus]|uniref:Uncharacterized protein n=1 Tax=Coprinellus micaceus TaxID=71717 RepID=A0A4Y7SS08_COPMI|nr:hypothetical protein FA13DRAFT_1797026 [Coprinellus micaceus]